MSRCLDTNDNEEISFAVEVLDSLIRDHYKTHPAAKEARLALNDFISSVPPDIFFTSFTTAPDLLSQWRGYAPAEGVSFGLSLKHIKALCIEFGLKFGRVEYNYEIQKIAMSGVVEIILEALSSSGKESSKLRSKAMRQFMKISPFIKHAAFSEEREWRIIQIPDGTARLQPQHKAFGESYRQIVELPIDPVLFKPSFIFGAIYLSPALSTVEEGDNIEKILTEHNLSTHRLQMSSIPYQQPKF